LRAANSLGTIHLAISNGPAMRTLPVFALTCLLIASCTPYIPVKDAFGTSGSKPTGTIPPEFAEFNNYDPQVNALLADQICATPYALQVEQSAQAAPGEIVAITGRCQTYAPALLGKLAQPFDP
jgi:hypothetical protein